MYVVNRVKVQKWCRLLEDRAASSLTLGQWCASQGVTYNLYYYWKRVIERRGHEVDEIEEEEKPAGSLWLGVQIQEPPQPPATGAITIRVAGLTLDIEAGFDPLVLSSVLAAMGAQPC
jgi:hypothetical protein